MLDEVVGHVKVLRDIDTLLDPETDTCKNRKALFEALAAKLESEHDPIRIQMSKVMRSFEKGLLIGGDDKTLPRDNLELERFFRRPKGHERKIHGHAHAGVRLVLRGPTLIPTLDAHLRHPTPFLSEELAPWLDSPLPPVLIECRRRAQVMRQARSHKQRPVLLDNLQKRYISSLQFSA